MHTAVIAIQGFYFVKVLSTALSYMSKFAQSNLISFENLKTLKVDPLIYDYLYNHHGGELL